MYHHISGCVHVEHVSKDVQGLGNKLGSTFRGAIELVSALSLHTVSLKTLGNKYHSLRNIDWVAHCGISKLKNIGIVLSKSGRVKDTNSGIVHNSRDTGSRIIKVDLKLKEIPSCLSEESKTVSE